MAATWILLRSLTQEPQRRDALPAATVALCCPPCLGSDWARTMTGSPSIADSLHGWVSNPFLHSSRAFWKLLLWEDTFYLGSQRVLRKVQAASVSTGNPVWACLQDLAASLLSSASQGYQECNKAPGSLCDFEICGVDRVHIQ